ncbi:MAG: DUF58 domain-containing protein [Candidatus Eisenbacteria sp.]|nr:DUF58 domain-containing protein [Candidatus Eisenbacteria bacterium]
MELKARLVVEGFIAGLHRGPYRGFSVEFAEHRAYMPGDPIKHVDWKVYAKTDRFFIKEFEEETNLRAYIVLDASASMGYRSGGMSKLEYGCVLAASLSYLMLKQQDSVGLLTFDTKIRRFIAPRSTRSHLHLLLGELGRVEAGERTNVGAALHDLAERIQRRGLIILISDLQDDSGKVLSGLRHFRHRKHEVLVFHVLDPSEVGFPFEGEVILRDLETHQEILTEPWRVRDRYQGAIREWLLEYRRRCGESLIDYVPTETSTPYDSLLFNYLHKRKRLG